jgi:hypothetical protein
MKRLLTLVTFGLLLLFIASCSESPTTMPGGTESNIVLEPRPEFVDDRPLEEIEKYVMNPSTEYQDLLGKKPPHPHDPPDTGSADPNPNPTNKYAYIVGISDYEGTVNDLQYPDDDAMDMKSYLQSQGFTTNVDLNRNATADNITAGLQWLINQAEPGDEIAFCYSGHGAKAPEYGSSIISTDLYYMTHGYVMQYFNAVDCTKKLVTLDCCVIGDFHQDAETGTVMATASNKTDSYDAPDLQQGAWTYFWLEAAEDLEMEYAEDVADYAEDGMKAWARPYHLRVSPKHSDKYSGKFDM